jgi:hypothetical protein
MKRFTIAFVFLLFSNAAYLQTPGLQKILEKKDVEYAYPRWSKRW